MTLNKFALFTGGGFAAFAIILTLSAPKLRAAVRATFVEAVLPSKPYNETITFSSSKSKTFGPNTGVLGISTITFTNFAPFVETIIIRQAAVVNGDCSSGTLVSEVAPDTTFLLQPSSTMVIPYSSPLVFSGVGGHTCLFAQVPSNINGDTIQLGLTGFVN